MNKKTKILLVEDDPSLGFVVKDNLENADFSVTLSTEGKSALQTFIRESFNLCILDIMLPQKDGFTLAKDIRKINETVPIIFLTAKSMIQDKAKGFKAGGDDYITKPFEMEELLLRIKAVLKRNNGAGAEPDEKNVFKIGEFDFDYKNLQLTADEKSKTLTKKEAELLKLLCVNENQIVERDMALNIVWGDDDYFLGRSMDVFIVRLRKYLKADPYIEIQNIRGVGFRLVVNKNKSR